MCVFYRTADLFRASLGGVLTKSHMLILWWGSKRLATLRTFKINLLEVYYSSVLYPVLVG